jgi:hypothetical protein
MWCEPGALCSTSCSSRAACYTLFIKQDLATVRIHALGLALADFLHAVLRGSGTADQGPGG